MISVSLSLTLWVRGGKLTWNECSSPWYCAKWLCNKVRFAHFFFLPAVTLALAVPLTFFLLPLISFFALRPTAGFETNPSYIIVINKSSWKTRHLNATLFVRFRPAIGLNTYSSEISLGIVLLLVIKTVINQTESSASATTEFGLDSENWNALLLGLENFGKFGLNLASWNGTLLWMDELNFLQECVKSENVLTNCFLAKSGFLRN